jgi:hypothetical protein
LHQNNTLYAIEYSLKQQQSQILQTIGSLQSIADRHTT